MTSSHQPLLSLVPGTGPDTGRGPDQRHGQFDEAEFDGSLVCWLTDDDTDDLQAGLRRVRPQSGQLTHNPVPITSSTTWRTRMGDFSSGASAGQQLSVVTVPDAPGQDDGWIPRLATDSPVRDEAIEQLLGLMIRGARHQVSRMAEAADLGQARRDEIVLAAADQATVAVLSRLDSFEGRSRFTTWAYKFAILHAAAEVRRTAWRSREIDLLSVPEPVSDVITPEDFVEARSMTEAMRRAITYSLTAHQQRVILALVLDGVPIDVLAERLHTNRNALYKTLHDARRRLREDLIAQGYLDARKSKEVSR